MKAVRIGRWVLLAVTLSGGMSSIGCQVDLYGMTLPSPHYLKDDVQYFAPGPDFPFANEEAALLENVPPVAP